MAEQVSQRQEQTTIPDYARPYVENLLGFTAALTDQETSIIRHAHTLLEQKESSNLVSLNKGLVALVHVYQLRECRGIKFRKEEREKQWGRQYSALAGVGEEASRKLPEIFTHRGASC